MKTTVPPSHMQVSQSSNPLPRRNWLALVATTAAAWGVGSKAVQAEPPIVIKFSHVVKPDTAKGRAALRFKALAESRTGGRVRVEVYPDNQLYQDREELAALKRGTVQMLAPSLSKLAELGGGDFEALDLPFLVKDSQSFRRAVDGPWGKRLLAKLEPSGIKGLEFWDNGFKVFTTNRRLNSPEAMRGLKMRVQASQVLKWQMEALGAKALAMPLERVLQSLCSKDLDGQENVPSNIYTQGLHECQSHMVVTNHGYLAYAVIVNRQFWDGLPATIRAQLETALREATDFANTTAKEENERALQRISASGKITVQTPTEAELRRWQSAMAPTHAKAKGRVSADTLAALRQAMGDPP